MADCHVNLQGHGGGLTPTPAKPAQPLGGHHPGKTHRHHTPVSHHHIKHPTHRQHQKQGNKPAKHTAPRNSLPVTELVQAMQWFVAPAAC